MDSLTFAATSPNLSISTPPDVAFVTMPFGPLFSPSIGLGLLKAGLTQAGIASCVHYFTLKFADWIGTTDYADISDGRPYTCGLLGEWLFSHALFGEIALDVEGYVNDVLRGQSPAYWYTAPADEPFIERVMQLRSTIEPFLDYCVEQVLATRPPIVGFTSIFQQQVASLALAKRIKQQSPGTFIVFGGANCENVMGIEVVRQFGFVDAVVSGEADLIFPELVQRVLAGKTLAGLPGVYTQDPASQATVDGEYSHAPSVYNLDVLPVPDYSDYFEQLNQSVFDKSYPVRLLFESSRGCWWGEKKHCTFCGLNGTTLTFRSKSAARAIGELNALAERYPGCPISVVDNIMDLGYFKDFVPQLAQQHLGLDLFYEVKANLKKEQIRQLRAAGITNIQPGVESLSTPVLQTMRKGVSGLQNIQLLKWCKELGVKPHWNILWGHPGERAEDYTEMAARMPLLRHLQPPTYYTVIRLHRFSPNFFDAEALGVCNIQPYPAYRYLYPTLSDEAIANLAYYFTFDYVEAQDVPTYSQPIQEEVLRWKQEYTTSDLFYVDKGEGLVICDLRSAAQQPLMILRGLQRELYLACDSIQTVHALKQRLNGHASTGDGETLVQGLLDPLAAAGLMLNEGNSYLSLAVRLGDYSPNSSILERFQQTLLKHGAVTPHGIAVPVSEPTAV